MHSELVWYTPKEDPPRPGRILAVYDDPEAYPGASGTKRRVDFLEVADHMAGYFLLPASYAGEDKHVLIEWVVAYIPEEEIIGDLP